MNWRIASILGLAALSSCNGSHPISAAATSTSSVGLAANALFVRDVDGDTIDVTVDGHAERIRLIGINTPETVKPNSPVECFGHEASTFTKSLLSAGEQLHLERDVEARDAYGRLLAYVYRVSDGLFVNLEVIRQGYAQVLTFPPNVAHTEDFVGAARAAEAANLGLWEACGK